MPESGQLSLPGRTGRIAERYQGILNELGEAKADARSERQRRYRDVKKAAADATAVHSEMEALRASMLESLAASSSRIEGLSEANSVLQEQLSSMGAARQLAAQQQNQDEAVRREQLGAQDGRRNLEAELAAEIASEVRDSVAVAARFANEQKEAIAGMEARLAEETTRANSASAVVEELQNAAEARESLTKLAESSRTELAGLQQELERYRERHDELISSQRQAQETEQEHVMQLAETAMARQALAELEESSKTEVTGLQQELERCRKSHGELSSSQRQVQDGRASAEAELAAVAASVKAQKAAMTDLRDQLDEETARANGAAAAADELRRAAAAVDESRGADSNEHQRQQQEWEARADAAAVQAEGVQAEMAEQDKTRAALEAQLRQQELELDLKRSELGEARQELERVGREALEREAARASGDAAVQAECQAKLAEQASKFEGLLEQGAAQQAMTMDRTMQQQMEQQQAHRREFAALKGRLAMVSATAEQQQAETVGARQALAELSESHRTELAGLRQELERCQAVNEQLSSSQREVQGRRANMEAELVASSERAAEQEAAMSGLQVRLAEETAHSNRASTAVDELRRAVAVAEESREALVVLARSSRDELTGLQQELERCQKKHGELSSSQRQAQDGRASAEAELAAAVGIVTAVEAQLAEETARANEAAAAADELRRAVAAAEESREAQAREHAAIVSRHAHAVELVSDLQAAPVSVLGSALGCLCMVRC